MSIYACDCEGISSHLFICDTLKTFFHRKMDRPALTGAAAAVDAAAILTLALELCVRVYFALLSLGSLLPKLIQICPSSDLVGHAINALGTFF